MDATPLELRTELGRKLFRLRQEAIANGMRLLTADEVLEEVARRRSGYPEIEYYKTDLPAWNED